MFRHGWHVCVCEFSGWISVCRMYLGLGLVQVAIVRHWSKATLSVQGAVHAPAARGIEQKEPAWAKLRGIMLYPAKSMLIACQAVEPIELAPTTGQPGAQFEAVPRLRLVGCAVKSKSSKCRP